MSVVTSEFTKSLRLSNQQYTPLKELWSCFLAKIWCLSEKLLRQVSPHTTKLQTPTRRILCSPKINLTQKPRHLVHRWRCWFRLSNKLVLRWFVVCLSPCKAWTDQNLSGNSVLGNCFEDFLSISPIWLRIFLRCAALLPETITFSDAGRSATQKCHRFQTFSCRLDETLQLIWKGQARSFTTMLYMQNHLSKTVQSSNHAQMPQKENLRRRHSVLLCTK